MRKEMTIASLRAMLDSGEMTPREALMLCRDVEEPVFSHPLHERALAHAQYAAERIAEKSTRDTTGVPIAVEETLCIAGVPNAFGLSTYDATITQKLDGYGALIVGTVRGAPLGASPDGSYGAHRAVASRQCAAALSSSLPFPLEGGNGAHPLTALKPSFGTVSRYGLAVAAPSLKQLCITAPTARDAAAMMDAISDFDPYDPAMARPNCYHYAQDIGKPARGMTIGAAEGSDTAPLQALGCDIRAVSMPEDIQATYAATLAAEAAFTLARCDEDLLQGCEGLVSTGRRVLEGGLYPQAISSREAIAQQLREALACCDALLMPSHGGGAALCAMAAELSGLPCAVRGDVMLIGRMYDEVTLLRLIGALEGGIA